MRDREYAINYMTLYTMKIGWHSTRVASDQLANILIYRTHTNAFVYKPVLDIPLKTLCTLLQNSLHCLWYITKHIV